MYILASVLAVVLLASGRGQRRGVLLVGDRGSHGLDGGSDAICVVCQVDLRGLRWLCSWNKRERMFRGVFLLLLLPAGGFSYSAPAVCCVCPGGGLMENDGRRKKKVCE